MVIGSCYTNKDIRIRNEECKIKNRAIKRNLIIAMASLFIVTCIASCGKTNNNSADSSIDSEENGSQTAAISVDMTSLTSGNYTEKTEAPVIVEYRTVADGRAVFSGTCEEGATIYVFDEEKALLTTQPHYGSFIFELAVKRRDSPKMISVYAKSEDKALSDAVQKEVYYRTDDKGISDWVWVGKDFHLFFSATEEQYYRNDLLSDSDAQTAKERFSERFKWLDDNLGAKPIYILVPNPNEIMGEYMPDSLDKSPDTLSLHDQTAQILADAGAYVIDMKPILQQHKNDEFFIYHNTDSHWTEYAAYFAYQKLFDYISKEFPASAPRPIEDFGFANESHQVGDLYTDLGMDETILYEMSTFSNIKFDTPVEFSKYKSENSTLIAEEPTKEHTFVNSDSTGKPNVILMRDSYSIMMFDFLAERCATTTMQAMWDFNYDTNKFTQLDVDYVLYIICDMNLTKLYK